MATHHAHCDIFETTPGGILGERYICDCGAVSTAAQMAQTEGGRMYNALFGHHPCPAIVRLHETDANDLILEL